VLVAHRSAVDIHPVADQQRRSDDEIFDTAEHELRPVR